jgi:hypothetical protein
LLGKPDIAPLVVGKMAQIHDQGLAVAGSGMKPELEARPKALHAAQAANVFVSHDNLPIFVLPKASAPSAMPVQGAPDSAS